MALRDYRYCPKSHSWAWPQTHQAAPTQTVLLCGQDTSWVCQWRPSRVQAPVPLSRNICTTAWDCPENFNSKSHALCAITVSYCLKRERKLKESTPHPTRCFWVSWVECGDVMTIYEIKRKCGCWNYIFIYFYIIFLS